MNKILLTIFISVAVILGLYSVAYAGDKNYQGCKRQKISIYEKAQKADQLSTLVAALNAAGLAETFKDAGSYTVFAPTNEAFAKLPEGTLNDLLKPENKDKLTQILTLHVSPKKLYAKKVLKADEIPTLEGSSLMVKQSGEKVFVNNSEIIKTDIKASNGVIHLIDTVILP